MQCYGARLRAIAAGIAGEAAADECVDDALYAAWNAIPPARPKNLFAYLCRITRNNALDRVRREGAEKRGGDVLRLSLDELAACVSDADDPARTVEAKALGAAIGTFLRQQKKQARLLFVARYFYAMPIAEIARRFSLRESTVKTVLRRTRLRLRTYLQEEEFL